MCKGQWAFLIYKRLNPLHVFNILGKQIICARGSKAVGIGERLWILPLSLAGIYLINVAHLTAISRVRFAIEMQMRSG